MTKRKNADFIINVVLIFVSLFAVALTFYNHLPSQPPKEKIPCVTTLPIAQSQSAYTKQKQRL